MESVQAPCRIAMQTKTRCPKCQRPVSIKTLKYTHTCGRTWDVEERVREEERKAHAKHAKHAKYAGLIAQINQTAGGPPGKAYVEMSLGKVLVPDIP